MITSRSTNKAVGHFVFFLYVVSLFTVLIWADIRRVAKQIKLQNSSYTVDGYIVVVYYLSCVLIGYATVVYYVRDQGSVKSWNMKRTNLQIWTELLKYFEYELYLNLF